MSVEICRQRIEQLVTIGQVDDSFYDTELSLEGPPHGIKVSYSSVDISAEDTGRELEFLERQACN